MPNRNIVGTGSTEYVPLSNNRYVNNNDNFNYHASVWMDCCYGYGYNYNTKLCNNDLITLYLTNKFPYKNRKEIDTIRKNVEKYIDYYFNKKLEIE